MLKPNITKSSGLSLAEVVEAVSHQRKLRRRDRMGNWVDARPKIKSGRPKIIRSLEDWGGFFYERCIINQGGCWEWAGRKMRNGYGKLVFEGYEVSAHRLSYLIHIGRIPAGICVLHKCDNKPCVNPDHFFLGTKGDNNRDCCAKGRRPIGENHPYAKLSDADVAAIRRSYVPRRNGKELAYKYGVTTMHLVQVALGHLRK